MIINGNWVMSTEAVTLDCVNEGHIEFDAETVYLSGTECEGTLKSICTEPCEDGSMAIIINVTNTNIIVEHDGSEDETKRILTSSGENYTLLPYTKICVQFVNVVGRVGWWII